MIQATHKYSSKEAHSNTRKLCYRKDDHVMCSI